MRSETESSVALVIDVDAIVEVDCLLWGKLLILAIEAALYIPSRGKMPHIICDDSIADLWLLSC